MISASSMGLLQPVRSFRSPERNAGLSLVEVLIALLVLSIGLVGMAALHLNSLQSAHSSYYRSIASTIVLDFEERLWLALAESDAAGCPDAAFVQSVRDQLNNDWNRVKPDNPDWQWSSASLIRIPNVTITTGTSISDGQWTLVPTTVSWAEDRFENETGTEIFNYMVRVLCRPAAA